MATRASFLIEQANGTFKGYYNHWDGYPASGLGESLLIAELNGSMKEFIQCYKDKGEYSFDFSFESIEQAVKDLKRSDREWLYIKTFSHGWLVFEKYYAETAKGMKANIIKHEETLLDIIKKQYKKWSNISDFQVNPKELEDAMKLARA